MILILAAALAAAAAPQCPDVLTSEAFTCKALQAMSGGKPADAARLFEEAAAVGKGGDPETSRLLAAAGNMWIAADQPGKAALALDRALAGTGLRAEQRGQALLDRARAAEAQNDLKTARAKYLEAAPTVGKDPFAHYFSAALAIRENDRATAQSAINMALSLAPNDPAILFEAGHVAHFLGHNDQARSYWTRAASGDPGGPVGKAAAKAVELLGVTPTVKSQPAAAR